MNVWFYVVLREKIENKHKIYESHLIRVIEDHSSNNVKDINNDLSLVDNPLIYFYVNYYHNFYYDKINY